MRPNRGVAADGGRILLRAGRRLWSCLRLSILAAGLTALVLLASVTGLLPLQAANHTALAAPFLPTPSPSVALISPSSGQGPVGANITLQGTGWTDPGDKYVAVGVASSAANCANPTPGWLATLVITSPNNSGTFTQTFGWPASFNATTPYALCASPASPSQPTGPGVAAPQTYTVRSSQPPTLSLSSSSVLVGQPFTITGSNFYGEPTINLSINKVFNQSATPDANGSFIITVTPTASQVGTASILAQSQSEGGAPPALDAGASITILAAATATPSVTPSPSITPSVSSTSTAGSGSLGGGGGGGGSQNTGGGGGLVIALIIAIVLILLVIGGAVLFLVLRRRGGGPAFPGGPSGPGGGPGGGWDGYPGPGRGTGPVPQYGQGYGQGATGRYGAPGTYGASGFYAQQDATTAPQVGGVASWDDAPPMGSGASWDDPGDSAPGPDWQPRPMSNSRRRYDDPGYSAYGAPEAVPVDPYGAPQTGGNAPPDPWNTGAGGYGGPTQGYPGPQGYPPPNRGATGYPPGYPPGHPQRPPRQQPPEDDWNGDEGNGGDWNQRGPGSTNPTNQGW